MGESRRASSSVAGFLLLLLAPFGIAVCGQSGSASIIHQPSATAKTSAKPDLVTKRRLIEDYGKLPLAFEANEGQTDARVKFLSRGSGYTLFLAGNEVVLELRGSGPRGGVPGKAQLRKPRLTGHVPPATNSILRMQLKGANLKAQVSGADELPGKTNYFIGNDPTKWRTNVPTYARVKYHGVYPGVDLVYYGKQGQLEYDFIVAPGANPGAIKLDVAPGFSPASGNAALKGGATRARQGHRSDPLRIAANGDLVVKISGGEVRFRKPVVYQPATGELQPRTAIDGRYRLAHHQVTFAIGSYDKTRPLVIDPALAYSTYLGGSNYDYGSGVALDTSGNAYVTGYTLSSDFPTTSGAFQTSCNGGINCSVYGDAFVTKVNPTGSALLYSTYLGGSSTDFGQGIAVDSSGNAHVIGVTESTNFPTTPGAFQTVCHDCNPPSGSAFVTALNSTGSALVYSTYLGGSTDDYGSSLSLDAAGDAYVTGNTESADFPVTSGAFQTECGGGCSNTNSFVTELNPTGSGVIYSTYLGGSGGDSGSAIVVDGAGDAYVAGLTGSTDFPTTPGAFDTSCSGCSLGINEDAFVSKLDPSGSALVYSTYLGAGIAVQYAIGMALDGSGDAYVTGYTESSDFPTTPGSFQTTCHDCNPSNNTGTAFVTVLNPAGSGLVYSTYLGGSSNDESWAVALDASGNAYVIGTTSSSDFPITPGSFQTKFPGNTCAFLTELNLTGSALVYSTYLGGNGGSGGDGIALDAGGEIYVTGSALSSFPTTPGAFQPAFGGMADAFVAKFGAGDQVWPLSLSYGNQTLGVTSAAQTATLSNSGTTALSITGISLTGANGADFAETNTCGTSLPAGSTCIINVTFTPTATGTRTAAVTITDNAPNSPQTVALSGTGILPIMTLSPSSLSFGNQLLGVTSPAQAVTLSTNGPLTITSIATSAPFAQTNNCGNSLGTGGSCTINVTFTPTALGLQNGTLTVTDNGAGSPQTVALSGIGVQPAVTLSPTSLTFATQTVFTTSSAKTVTLTNTGTGTLTVTSIAVSGQFTQTNTCGTSVAPGGSCTINVTFRPTNKGTLTGTVTVTDNAPGSPQTVSLTGTGTYVQLKPVSLNFGSQPVGTKSLPKKITLTNKGSVAVSISKISITGADSGDFADTNTCGKSVAGGASCFISVTFTPSAKGKRTANASVSDNGGGSPQMVALTGTGT